LRSLPFFDKRLNHFFDVRLLTIFGAVKNVVFAGGFREKRVQNLVFSWSGCGESRGKAGRLAITFRRQKTRHFLQLYFAQSRIQD
jgi:hypothetical protein